MSSFDSAAQRIAKYRICLERDAARGVIPPAALAAADGCLCTVQNVLESARIEIEGAGAGVAARGMGDLLVSGCAVLALRVFRAMYREADVVRLIDGVEALRGDPHRLLEQLRRRLPSAA